MTLGSNSCKTIFYIRFPSHNLENKMPFLFFHQLFFISLFLEDRFSEAVISKCHFPGTTGFQCFFSLSMVTEVSPRAATLRVSLSSWLKIYAYNLSILFGLCFCHWTHTHSSASRIALPLDHSSSCSSLWMSLYLALFYSSLLSAVRVCIIQKLKRDFSGRFWCIYTFFYSFVDWVFKG